MQVLHNLDHNHSTQHSRWRCHEILIPCVSLERKIKSFAVIKKFLVALQVSYSDDDRIDQRTWSWLCDKHKKNKSLPLSSGVVGNWRFGVWNRQCHCQNCEENSNLCVFLFSCLSLWALHGLRPSSLRASRLDSMHFSAFLIDLTGTPGLYSLFDWDARTFNSE